MIKKLRMIALFLALAMLIFSLIACSHSEDDKPETITDAINKQESLDIDESAASPDQISPEDATEEVSKMDGIQGKIHRVDNAGGRRVFLSADRLYLYDLDTNSIMAEAAHENLDQVRIHALDNGYVIVGMETQQNNAEGLFAVQGPPSYAAVHYDHQLNKISTLSYSTLLDENEMIWSTKAIAFSSDGKKTAFATNQGLYLYNLDTGKKSSIMSFDANHTSGIVTMEQISFTHYGQTIAFIAQSYDTPAVDGSVSFDTCGTVDVDGSRLSNHRFENYTCKELIAYPDQLLLAEDPSVATGRLLVLDIPEGTTKVYELVDQQESGAVTGSDSGAHFATSIATNNGWTIRIYDTATGKLQSESFIPVDDERYLANVPLIAIQDEGQTYIALIGAKQREIVTKVYYGQF